MIMLKKIIKTSTLLCIGVLLASCNCGKKTNKGIEERKERLARLEKEAADLTEEVRKIVDPYVWEKFLELTLEAAKKEPESAKSWLEGTRNTIFALYETRKNIAQRSFRTEESLSEILERLARVGFKAEDRDEAIESLEIWEKFLENINEQHKLRKQLGQN